MKYSPLRILLAMDAAVLGLLGLVLMLAPKQVERHDCSKSSGVSSANGFATSCMAL